MGKKSPELITPDKKSNRSYVHSLKNIVSILNLWKKGRATFKLEGLNVKY